MIRTLGDLREPYPWSFWLLLAACVYFAVLGLRLSLIDIRSHRLPNRIVLPAYAVAGVLLAGAAVGHRDWERLLTMLAAAAVLWLGYFLLRLIYPPGMGYGDVKLAGVLGLYLGFLGWGHVLWGTLAAFLLGGLWGLGLILTGRGTGRSAIAFGPFMLGGTAAALVLLPV